MAGTAVLRIVVSRDSMKNATATSHGNRRLLASEGWDGDAGEIRALGGFIGNYDAARSWITLPRLEPAMDRDFLRILLSGKAASDQSFSSTRKSSIFLWSRSRSFCFQSVNRP